MATGDGAAGRVPNTLLATARRMRRLTQQQLAEAVHAAHWRLFGKEAAIDADHVSKLERGIISWPGAGYRAALRDVLGADTDAELGFYYRRAADTVDGTESSDGEVSPVRRDEFIGLLGGLGAGVGLGLPGLDTGLPDQVREVLARATNPGDPPSQVGHTDVERVREITATILSWQGRYGGGVCREAQTGLVRWATGLLRGRTTGVIRCDLHSAVGFLAGVAGWNDVDSGHHVAALGNFRLGLYCAEEASDWTLRAELLTDMTRQAVDRGLIDDATSLIELAQVRADRVSGTGRTMMKCAHARVLGLAGQVSGCQGAVAAAEDYFTDQPQPLDEYCGLGYFHRASATDLAYDNGSALFYAGLRDPVTASAAISTLRAALAHPDAISRRRRAMSTVKVATLELLHGDRDEGIALGRQALHLGAGLRSTRLTEDLRRLRIVTVRQAPGGSVDALQQQLDSVLRSA